MNPTAWPTRIWLRYRSGTLTSTFTVSMSTRVVMSVLRVITWPGLTWREAVMPEKGAVTRASASSRRFRSTLASFAEKVAEA